MDASAVERAAELLVRGRRAVERLQPLPDDVRPATIAEGHAVQDAVHARLASSGAGEVAGHKIGATTPPMQAYLGLTHPCAGGVSSSRISADTGVVDLAHHVEPGLEGELAVTIGEDVPPDPGGHDARSLARHVASWHAAIEVVDNRYGDFLAFGAPTLVADDFFAAGAVLGPPVSPSAVDDVAAVEGRMVDTGVEVGTGVGGAILGHPLNALVWLADHYGALGTPLRAGEVVLLGSLFRVHWIRPESRQVSFEVRGLGVVTVEVVGR